MDRYEWPSSDGQTNFVADERGVWLEGPSRARLLFGPPIEVAAEILRLAARVRELEETVKEQDGGFRVANEENDRHIARIAALEAENDLLRTGAPWLNAKARDRERRLRGTLADALGALLNLRTCARRWAPKAFEAEVDGADSVIEAIRALSEEESAHQPPPPPAPEGGA